MIENTNFEFHLSEILSPPKENYILISRPVLLPKVHLIITFLILSIKCGFFFSP